MFEHETVKIRNPQRPVWPSLEHDRSKPRIPRGDELLCVGTLGPAALKAEPVRCKYFSAYDIVSRSTDKKELAGRLLKQLITIRCGAVAGGDMLRRAD